MKAGHGVAIVGLARQSQRWPVVAAARGVTPMGRHGVGLLWRGAAAVIGRARQLRLQERGKATAALLFIRAS